MAYNPMAFVHNVPAAVANRIAAIRPRTTSRPTATRRPVSQTIDQAAAAQVNQLLAPQLAGQAAYGRQQNAAIQGFAQALMGKLSPIAGQVGADWDKAIGQTGELANRAATFLQQANPNASLQALIPGAPPEQQQQIAGQLGQTFGGGAAVLDFLGGAVPGTQMATEKAAAQTQAAQYPALAALRGQQNLASALWKQSTDRQTIEAQRPQLQQAAVKDIQATRIANQRLAQQAQAAKATAVYRQQQLGQGQQRIDLGYAKAKQAAYDKALDRAATKTYHDSYLAHLSAGDSERVAHDKATEAATSARLAISQQQANTSAYSAQTGRINAATARGRANAYAKAQAAKAAKAAKGQGRAAPQLTAAQVQKFRGTAATVADNAQSGFTDSQGVKHDPLSPAAALKEMRHEGIPDAIAIAAINRAYGTRFNPKGFLP